MSIIHPVSAFPVTAGKVMETVYSKTGTQDIHVDGFGFMASLDADAIWRFMFVVPPELPSGTPKLVIDLFADATSGVIKLNPAWKSFAPNVDLTGAAFSAEGLTPDAKTGGGSTDTMEWATGDSIQFLSVKWTMNATTAPAAGERVFLDLKGVTSGWTLAATLTTLPYILWE